MEDTHGRTALYRLYDKYGGLLYVGITSDPERRFAQHAADKEWWPAVASLAVDWHARRRDAELAEEAAIKVHVPPFNKEHSPEWPHVRITVEIPPSMARALDRLCRIAASDGTVISRDMALFCLLDREIAARALGGERPCFHSGMGWPDGVKVMDADDGICACGSPILPDGRWACADEPPAVMSRAYRRWLNGEPS